MRFTVCTISSTVDEVVIFAAVGVTPNFMVMAYEDGRLA